jgi:hypothetical protein
MSRSHRFGFLAAALTSALLAASASATTFNYDNGSAPPNPANVIDGFVSMSSFDLFEISGGTTVAITAGGVATNVFAHDTSHVEMSGGDVWGLYLAADGSASITMTGGTVHYLIEALGSSDISFLGGYVDNQIRAWNDAHITIAGGTIGSGYLHQIRTFHSGSLIEIYGTDFAVDGVPVAYGDLTAVTGRLTGTLSSGDLLDNTFQRVGGNGTIRLVHNPEPGTGLLLGAGLIALARRRRAG